MTYWPLYLIALAAMAAAFLIKDEDEPTRLPSGRLAADYCAARQT